MSKLNIVIATHGKFGEEIIKSAEMIVGKMNNLKSVSLMPSMSFEDFTKEADAVLSNLSGDTLVLVDLYGGTPCNVFTALTKKYNHNVITGLNLPMLIDLYINTNDSNDVNVKEVIENCISILKTSCVHTNTMLD
ncbi:PTS sugar transporter subunit IIA [Clostridium nigeriense]|uniref:PTS sugar transporter subunit IIA n=1 Tax=Clostridium nigeriense TaxID=1805470 RepID=UPI003D357C05